MDLHPSGLPHLVGPEGAPFPHSDYSHSFRYLPNNVVSEFPPPNVETLSMMRSHPHPLRVRSAPSSPRSAPALPPLRLRTEISKPGSPREQLSLPSSPSHLLTSGSAPLPALPNRNSRASAIAAGEVTVEVTIAAAESVDVHQASASSTSKE